MMIILEISPKPNQIVRSGARMIKGIVWEIIRMGYRMFLIRFDHSISKEAVTPRTIAQNNPNMASKRVGKR
jgi:hypothetical protein